jgi:hypothetical protein
VTADDFILGRSSSEGEFTIGRFLRLPGAFVVVEDVAALDLPAGRLMLAAPPLAAVFITIAFL